MARAMQRHLATLTFYNNGGPFKFAQVFDQWPHYIQRYVPATACVLPSAWDYVDWSDTPKLMEDTWEVQGEPGFGLYKLSETNLTLELSFRGTNAVTRSQILRGIEEGFQAPGLLMDEQNGPRYGLILPLPEYYGLSARFALQGARVIDDEERAMREQRDAVVTISGQAAQVKVGPVYPLRLTIKQTVC